MENDEFTSIIASIEGITYDQFVNALKTLNWWPSNQVDEFLAALGPKKTYEFIAQGFNDSDPKANWLVLDAIRKTDVSLFTDLLIDLLEDEDKNKRSEAITLLVGAKDERVIDPLINALGDSDDMVRLFAAVDLGSLKAKKAVKPLLELLQNDDDGYVIRAVAQALIKIGDYQAVEPLLNFLEKEPILVEVPLNGTDTNIITDFRSDIIRKVGEFKDLRTYPYLVNWLKDEDEEIRASATFALGYSGAPEAVDLLIQALADESADVREVAAETLGVLANKKATKPLINLLNDPDKSVHYYTIQALGNLGDEQALQPLKEIMENDKELRKLAAESIEKIENKHK